MEELSKRTGGYIELLGTYNPLTEPKDIKLKQDRIDHWQKLGAQPSTGFLRIIGKAPQRPPRKPKKESKQVTGDSGQVKQKQETKTEQDKPTEEAKSKVSTTPTPTNESQPSPKTEAPKIDTPAEESTLKEEPKNEGSA